MRPTGWTPPWAIAALATLAAVAVLAGTALASLGCGRAGGAGRETLQFWALGREGEVVAELVPEFERLNPGIHVVVQQTPFLAAHEKLLTASVGHSLPDLAQVGNTWIPELEAVHAVAPLGDRVAASKVLSRQSFFPGIWDTNLVAGTVYGIPWYVDTRLLFYRTDLLAAVGATKPPATWAEWLDVMRRLKVRGGKDHFAILLPTDEWTQPIILGAQMGAPLLRDGDRYGAFRDPRFRQAFHFYVGLFREGLAPAASNAQIGNLYQQFAQGVFAMYITGPWNVGEIRRRLPELAGRWQTAPLPGPVPGVPGVSLAGGSSLVIFGTSKHQEAAWRLIEFLSEPRQQVRFYTLSGDLPAVLAAWKDPVLAEDSAARAFEIQLRHLRATPQIPEWEQIADLVRIHAEAAVRGSISEDEALRRLDLDTDQVLAKRRWVLARREAQK